MIHKEWSPSKKVEKTEVYYERTCLDYYVTCDSCGKKLSDGDDMYEVLLCKSWKEEEETKTLCKECAKKAAVAWIDREGELEIEIDHSTVNSSEFIGKTSYVSKDLHEVLTKAQKGS